MSASARPLLQITTAVRLGWAVAAVIESDIELIQFLPKFKHRIESFWASIHQDYCTEVGVGACNFCRSATDLVAIKDNKSEKLGNRN